MEEQKGRRSSSLISSPVELILAAINGSKGREEKEKDDESDGERQWRQGQLATVSEVILSPKAGNKCVNMRRARAQTRANTQTNTHQHGRMTRFRV